MVFPEGWIFFLTSSLVMRVRYMEMSGERNPSRMENHTKCIFSRFFAPQVMLMHLSHNSSQHGATLEVCEKCLFSTQLCLNGYCDSNLVLCV